MITLIGLGAGDLSALSLGARSELEVASVRHRDGTGKLFLRTERHPLVEALREQGLCFDTFDCEYSNSPNFETVYANIADAIMGLAAAGIPVGYAVPGHPLFAEESVRILRQFAAVQHIPVTVAASASFVDAVMTAAGADLADGCDVRDALTLPLTDEIGRDGARIPGRPDTARGLLLYQVYDALTTSRVKLALMQDYPDDWEVVVVTAAGVVESERVTRTPLHRLDRMEVDHLTSVYVPPLSADRRRARFPELVGLMARLRAPDGCPWDREQTPKTLRRYFIEETYEVIEAIDADDPELLCEELGDVLLQIVFHAQLAAEDGTFTIDDVTEGIVSKLVRRHPHVFGEVNVADSAEVLRNWDRIKKEEKQGDPNRRRTSVLDGVPKGLPALMQAMELSKRVAKVGFEWDSLESVVAKLDEETAELKAELAQSELNSERIASELGDVLFTVVQIARWRKIDAEEALRSMMARFSQRFRYVERRSDETGKPLADCTPEELDVLWNEAKRES